MPPRIATTRSAPRSIASLFAALLVCSIASCGGSSDDQATATDQPAAVVATDVPVEAAATSTEFPAATATEAATATIEATVTKPPTAVPPTTAPTEVPATAAPQPAALPAGVVDRDPNLAANCGDFPSPAAAQSWWNYYRGQGNNNPGGLDGDGDGDVCEQGNDGPSSGSQPVAPAPAAPSVACSGAKTCNEFGSHAEAQAYWEACGRPDKMDRDGDGVVCESLP